MIFFLCFGFVAVVPGNPETQTVSHFLPESLHRVAKEIAESKSELVSTGSEGAAPLPCVCDFEHL
jgi:hypothetical protein